MPTLTYAPTPRTIFIIPRLLALLLTTVTAASAILSFTYNAILLEKYCRSLTPICGSFTARIYGDLQLLAPLLLLFPILCTILTWNRPGYAQITRVLTLSALLFWLLSYLYLASYHLLY